VPNTRPKESSASIENIISFIENYLEHAKYNEKYLEFIPCSKQSENNVKNIHLKIIPNSDLSINGIKNQQPPQWLTQATGLA